jgi:hypothetical protein
MPRIGPDREASETPPWRTTGATLLQWASETGAHGMPAPQELERFGWHRLAEHPLFQGTWLMETPERAAALAPQSAASSERTLGEGPPRLV